MGEGDRPNGFFDKMLDTLLNGYNTKKISAWKIVNCMVLKYDLPVKVQGFQAIVPVQKILKEYRDRLTEREVEFLERVSKGEFM